MISLPLLKFITFNARINADEPELTLMHIFLKKFLKLYFQIENLTVPFEFFFSMFLIQRLFLYGYKHFFHNKFFMH